ncbi:MAG: radical SAM protein [Candidatus Bathyarchaeota archaeon]|nr:radical SAM protein [Candidatus Bathyarchaeota archaeon]
MYKKHPINKIYVHLTHACNLNCKYCYFDASEVMKNEMSSDEFYRLCEEILTISPKKVVFTGGEPLLRSDLLNIATYLRSLDPYKRTLMCLMTNGKLIDEEKAGCIAQVFDEVRVSIDGPKEINDNLRGPGSFDDAMRAIHYFKQAGIYPSLSITVTSANLPHLSKWLSFILKEGIATKFHLTQFRQIGRGSLQPALDCSSTEIRLVMADFWQRHFGIPLNQESIKKPSLISCGNCGVGKYVNILPDGSIYPCHVLSSPKFFLGNIKENKLAAIIEESNLLKQLLNINFINFKGGSDHLKQILGNTACLGEVYREAPKELLDAIESSIV